jgi:hypothetical protein
MCKKTGVQFTARPDATGTDVTIVNLFNKGVHGSSKLELETRPLVESR